MAKTMRSFQIGSGSDLLSQGSCPSTISAGGLNFRVRDGNGCGPSAVAARKSEVRGQKSDIVRGRSDLRLPTSDFLSKQSLLIVPSKLNSDRRLLALIFIERYVRLIFPLPLKPFRLGALSQNLLCKSCYRLGRICYANSLRSQALDLLVPVS